MSVNLQNCREITHDEEVGTFGKSIRKKRMLELTSDPALAAFDEDLTRRFDAEGCRVFRLSDGRIVVDLYGQEGQLYKDVEELMALLDQVHNPKICAMDSWEQVFGSGIEYLLPKLSEVDLALATSHDQEVRWRFWDSAGRKLKESWSRDDIKGVILSVVFLGEAVRRRLKGRWTVLPQDNKRTPAVEDPQGLLYDLVGPVNKWMIEDERDLGALYEALPGYPPDAYAPQRPTPYMYIDGMPTFDPGRR